MLLFVGPIMLRLIINFVSKNSTAPVWLGLVYVATMFVAASIQSICLHQYFFIAFKVGMQARAAVVTAVYQKAFRLSSRARQKSTVGEIVNLQAIDSQRFLELIPYLHMIWSAPFQIIFSTVMLWTLMGPSVLAGLGLMVVMIPLNAFIARKLGAMTKKTMEARDKRTKITSEVMNSVRVIKFFAWEQSFFNTISDIRYRFLYHSHLL
jgi:ATP-binding cassette, subfamily C (CFTR/MRP), member 1